MKITTRVVLGIAGAFVWVAGGVAAGCPGPALMVLGGVAVVAAGINWATENWD